MSKDSLHSRIAAWLSKQGYPFELHVGRIFRSAGWGVEHAQLFTDPETGKVREIDVVASTRTGQPELGSVGIQWVVECKSTAEHPWVVFTSKGRSDGIAPSAAYMAPGMIGTAIMIDALESVDSIPTYSVPPLIGHGVVRAFGETKSTDPSAAYSALLSATAAANALARSNAAFWTKHGGDIAVLNAFMPMVVIDGPLFELDLTDNGEEILREAVKSVVWCRNPGGETDATLVNVITVTELLRFAKQSLADSSSVLERALVRAPEIWKKYRTRSPDIPF